MQLDDQEQRMLAGEAGSSAQKAMEILVALGEIYGAERMLKIRSVQIAGVSYDNLGAAGLEFLREMSRDGRVQVLTTLNPAGMDVLNWQRLGIDAEFAAHQTAILDAFTAMGVLPTCTCTPYLVGNLPRFGEHVAWSESSAVCFANSVLGARTNREGGPSALAAALTGRTPDYGLHQTSGRAPKLRVRLNAKVESDLDFGALGYVLGKRAANTIVWLDGLGQPSLELLKTFSASLATYAGVAMFHAPGITPDAAQAPRETIEIDQAELNEAQALLNDISDADAQAVDFVSVGCPHLSLDEVRFVAGALDGKRVRKETWIHLARPVFTAAERAGLTERIEKSGAKIACDTCMVVAPLKGRFHGLATNSAKCVYYARGKNKFKVMYRTLGECLRLATEE
jgi:hypothetical protein